MLLGFERHYVQFIHRTGGASHDTFRTAAIEPKQAALDEVLRQGGSYKQVRIVTSEYWIEKPLLYLTAGKSQISVGGPLTDDSPLTTQHSAIWFVEFTDSAACRQVRESLRRRGKACRETQIKDYAGRPVLSLIQP
jgi:hypothetical protein